MSTSERVDVAIDALVEALSATTELDARRRALVHDLFSTAAGFASPATDLLDLKIATNALRELTAGFTLFQPWRHQRKVTMFGSARTRPDDPIYHLARDLAAQLADEGWMIVTGAGPGIMAAGIEGAGTEQSFGVNIALPFEQGANSFIAEDPKLIEMKYFFTRKLMLTKESAAFAILPGGFGTLDESFELLTLLQTGKAQPAPVVLVETKGGTYWQQWLRFVQHEAVDAGWISHDDLSLFTIATTASEAATEIRRFYATYHSMRAINGVLTIRCTRVISHDECAALSERFADIIATGTITPCEPSPAEIAEDDALECSRICFSFDRIHHGRLRQLIDALNDASPNSSPQRQPLQPPERS